MMHVHSVLDKDKDKAKNTKTMALTLAMEGQKLFHQSLGPKMTTRKKKGILFNSYSNFEKTKSFSLQVLTLLGRPHLVVDLICFGKNITQLKKHLTSEFGGYQLSVGKDGSQTRLKKNS